MRHKAIIGSITLLLTCGSICLQPVEGMGRDSRDGSSERRAESVRPGGPKGMELYEKSRLANEEMIPVVMEEEALVVPPGEDPPSDMPLEPDEGGVTGDVPQPQSNARR